MFNLEEYMSLIYRNIWSNIYNHIQDVLFFTRAELYPVDLSTKGYANTTIKLAYGK